MEEDEHGKDSSLPRWVLLEYSQMLKLAGEGSKVVFTHISESSCIALDQALHHEETPHLNPVNCSFTLVGTHGNPREFPHRKREKLPLRFIRSLFST